MKISINRVKVMIVIDTLKLEFNKINCIARMSKLEFIKMNYISRMSM